ncbi:nucleotide-binding alpha-beta plait domain-containing protein [Tanacetum coccineum]
MENAEDGWTKVQRRGQRNKSPNADFVKVIKDKSITFFFTRIPDSIKDKSLWKLFGKYGTLEDVYLASKRTKSGTRFGFVCYINVYEDGNENVDVKKEWQWTFRKDDTNREVNKDWQWTVRKQLQQPPHDEHDRCGMSYKDVMLGNKEETNKRSNKVDEETTLFKQEGLGGGIIHYVGGLSFLWIPSPAWETATVEKISCKFGSVLEVDDMEGDSSFENLVGVLVLTKNMSKISKSLSVGVCGRVYEIKIKEDRNRSFFISEPATSEDRTWEEDFTNNQDERDSEGISETDLGRSRDDRNVEDDTSDEEHREVKKLEKLFIPHAHADSLRGGG